MKKLYNVLKINHETRLDNSCGCQARSRFANVEVLYVKLTREQVDLFTSEVSKSGNKEAQQEENFFLKQSAFMNIPYGDMYRYYADLFIGNIAVVEILSL